jgi:hypothetical protein
MFLNSSRSIKSKILEAAILVDSEYRRLQATNGHYQLTGEPLLTEGGVRTEKRKQIAEQPGTVGESIEKLVSAQVRPNTYLDKRA